MQLVAVLVLALFVSHSNQERFIWPSPIAPRAHLMPLFYADGQPAGEIEPEQTEPGEKLFFRPISIPSLPSFSLPSVISIPSIPGMPSHPPITIPSLPIIPVPPIPSVSVLPRPKPSFTITKTLVTTVISTVSTPLTSKCIPSSQFASAAGGISTAACARRRRDVEEIVEQESISPALPLSLEASAVESIIPEAVGLKELSSIPLPEPQVEIESSQLDNNDIEQRKFNSGLPKISSVVETITSYTFVPIIVKESAIVAVASALLCLPSGYIVC